MKVFANWQNSLESSLGIFMHTIISSSKNTLSYHLVSFNCLIGIAKILSGTKSYGEAGQLSLITEFC